MTETVNRVLTPELQEKLNKVSGLTKEHTFLYVPKVYREIGPDLIPKSEWPVFKLRGKNGLEIAEAEDNSGYMDTEQQRLVITAGKARLQTLANNILGWKNFKDREGNLVEFVQEKNVVYKTALQRLSAELQRELHEAINEQSVLTEEELQGLEY